MNKILALILARAFSGRLSSQALIWLTPRIQEIVKCPYDHCDSEFPENQLNTFQEILNMQSPANNSGARYFCSRVDAHLKIRRLQRRRDSLSV